MSLIQKKNQQYQQQQQLILKTNYFFPQVRKIRCDGLPGGCSPCLQNNTECRTTDRITGRATSRGYVEGLEQQNRDMEARIRDLETMMVQQGLDVKPTNGYHSQSASNFSDLRKKIVSFQD